MRTKVQYVAPFSSTHNLYYVRDTFGKVWHSIGANEKEAKEQAHGREDVLCFTLYNPIRQRTFHKYDFKNLILDMLEQMGLENTYEYEIVLGWNETDVFLFMKKSSLMPCDLLLEINKHRGETDAFR
ncbi:hypothetical protein [Paenibacillus illinoisensis]|uniref:Uncharacterized protein n=1 Tax=Paenibacillus illinoisensis TaxID=59845 RepID=A0A2W0C6K0_9BACL|nr:hypothetical protein [Paenibacillus illinoisensis]PYY28373.1 hypothetical protein PIL02S_03529 [Paenibacillus illinoisensis]